MHEAIQGLGIPDFSSESIRRLLVKYDSTGGNEEIDFDNFIMICVSLARFKETYDIMKTKFGSIGLKDMTLEDVSIAYSPFLCIKLSHLIPSSLSRVLVQLYERIKK